MIRGLLVCSVVLVACDKTPAPDNCTSHRIKLERPSDQRVLTARIPASALRPKRVTVTLPERLLVESAWAQGEGAATPPLRFESKGVPVQQLVLDGATLPPGNWTLSIAGPLERSALGVIVTACGPTSGVQLALVP